jgi:hypothetical protein
MIRASARCKKEILRKKSQVIDYITAYPEKNIQPNSRIEDNIYYISCNNYLHIMDSNGYQIFAIKSILPGQPRLAQALTPPDTV